MTFAPFLLALFAFMALGLATDPHHRARFGSICPAPRRMRMRIFACACLACGFVAAWRVWGPVVGPIGWVATLMPGAAASFCALNFLPRAVRLPRSPRDL